MKKTIPQQIRRVERIHIVIDEELAKRLRDAAERDGQTLSVKISRTLEKGLAA